MFKRHCQHYNWLELVHFHKFSTLRTFGQQTFMTYSFELNTMHSVLRRLHLFFRYIYFFNSTLKNTHLWLDVIHPYEDMHILLQHLLLAFHQILCLTHFYSQGVFAMYETLSFSVLMATLNGRSSLRHTHTLTHTYLLTQNRCVGMCGFSV